MHLLRQQRVEVQVEQGLSACPVLAPAPLSRAQRAHDRLDFPERLARNVRIPTASQVTIRLFGVPEGFATSLGLATASPCFASRWIPSSRTSMLLPVEPAFPFFLAVPPFLPSSALFALHPAVSATSHQLGSLFSTAFAHPTRN